MLRRISNLQPDTRTLSALPRWANPTCNTTGWPRCAASTSGGSRRRWTRPSRRMSSRPTSPAPDYGFHHGLMRAAIDDSLLPADRAGWHRGWAQQLDRDGTTDDPLDAIAAAHHWAQTRDDVRAFDAAVRAAEMAEAFGAESERATLLTRVLDLWPRVSDAEERAGRERDTVLLHILSAHGVSGSAADVEAAASLLNAELAQSDARDSHSAPVAACGAGRLSGESGLARRGNLPRSRVDGVASRGTGTSRPDLRPGRLEDSRRAACRNAARNP